MSAEAAKNNVAPLDETGKVGREPDGAFIGTRCDSDRVKRYNRAWVEGDFQNRSEFILAACDALAEKLLGPAPG